MITLYTAPTPNGWKISVLLEELGVPYRVELVNLTKSEQKTDAYVALNPNGRIPTIIDHEADDFVVFESGAIMVYLAQKHQKLMPLDPLAQSTVMQWLMLQMAGVGPMMGQANVFHRYFSEKIPAVIERYQNEVKRLFGVLDQRLADHAFLAGDYSIADIAHWCWVHTHNWSGVELVPFKHLKRWNALIGQRPAVQRGINVPGKVNQADIKKAGQQLIK